MNLSDLIEEYVTLRLNWPRVDEKLLAKYGTATIEAHQKQIDAVKQRIDEWGL